nr:MAG TPA: hypothetical protein [Caudoviricetes sp.]
MNACSHCLLISYVMSTVSSCTSRIVSRCRYALIIVPLIHCSLSSVAHGFMSFRQELIRSSLYCFR